MATSEKKTKKKVQVKDLGGRPTTYTKDIADELCSYLSMGESLRTACAHDNMPSVKTVFNWFRTADGFLQQYTRAKEEAADAMAEEILYISDTPVEGEETVTRIMGDKQSVEMKKGDMIAHRRLQVDTRKFLMAKMKPKRYGDKLDLTSDGKALPTPIYGGQSGNKAKTNK